MLIVKCYNLCSLVTRGTLNMKISLTWIFLIIFESLDAYQILAVFPFPSRSIFLTFKPLMKALALKRHNVTVITHFQRNEDDADYNEIIIDGGNIFSDARNLPKTFSTKLSQLIQQVMFPIIFSHLSFELCNSVFKNQNVQFLLNSTVSYDVVFLPIFQTECVYYFAKRFKSPIVAFHSTVMVSWAADRFGLPMNTAIVPNHFLPFGKRMTFLERVVNALVTWGHILYYYRVKFPIDEKIIWENFGEEDAAGHNDVIYNTSLFMINTHFSVNLPRVLLPNVVEVGGLHIDKATKLPEV